MKAVILSGPNDFAPGEIEKPLIGDHDILLEMKKSGYLWDRYQNLRGDEDERCPLSFRDRARDLRSNQ